MLCLSSFLFRVLVGQVLVLVLVGPVLVLVLVALILVLVLVLVGPVLVNITACSLKRYIKFDVLQLTSFIVWCRIYDVFNVPPCITRRVHCCVTEMTPMICWLSLIGLNSCRSTSSLANRSATQIPQSLIF